MTGAEQLTCRELAALATEYLDDAMARAEREAFEAHLDGCRDCAAYVDQMHQLIRALGALDLP